MALILQRNATTGVQAADWYVGAAVGRSDDKVDFTGATSSDKADTGYELFAVARLSPNLAIEGGFADLGKATGRDATTSASIKLTALYLDAAGIAPLSPQWDVDGRQGLTSSKLKISGSVGGAAGSDSDRSVQPHFGLGGQYSLGKTVSARAEWGALPRQV